MKHNREEIGSYLRTVRKQAMSSIAHTAMYAAHSSINSAAQPKEKDEANDPISKAVHRSQAATADSNYVFAKDVCRFILSSVLESRIEKAEAADTHDIQSILCNQILEVARMTIRSELETIFTSDTDKVEQTLLTKKQEALLDLSKEEVIHSAEINLKPKTAIEEDVNKLPLESIKAKLENYLPYASEYYCLLSRLSKETSEQDLTRIEKLLAKGQVSPEMAFLIAEVDNLLLAEELSCSTELEHQAVGSIKRAFEIYRETEDPILEKQLERLRASQKRKKTASEYLHLISDLDGTGVDADVDRLCEILDEAEYDDELALVLNEIDNWVIKEGISSDCGQPERYKKYAESFREHVETCYKTDDVSRLMTQLSGMIDKLQSFRESEACDGFDIARRAAQKVDSLKELKKEAKVEQSRQKLRDTFTSQPDDLCDE